MTDGSGFSASGIAQDAGSAGATAGAASAATAAAAENGHRRPERSRGGVLRRRLASRRTLLSPFTVGAALAMAAVVAFAIAPQLFAPGSPLYGDSALRLLPPSLEHPFGTDQLGRDVFSRFIHGSAASLQATAIALSVAAGGGTLLGVIAGYAGGVADDIVSRILEVLLAIPGLLLSLTIIAALGFGTEKIGLAVGVAGIPSFARVMRAEVRRVRTSPYVEAAVSLGARSPALLAQHVIPHAIGPVIVLAVLEIASAVLAVSALTFLGFGSPPPAPEWGLLVAEGRDYLGTAWWLSILPGLSVALVVVSANQVARALEKNGARG